MSFLRPFQMSVNEHNRILRRERKLAKHKAAEEGKRYQGVKLDIDPVYREQHSPPPGSPSTYVSSTIVSGRHNFEHHQISAAAAASPNTPFDCSSQEDETEEWSAPDPSPSTIAPSSASTSSTTLPSFDLYPSLESFPPLSFKDDDPVRSTSRPGVEPFDNSLPPQSQEQLPPRPDFSPPSPLPLALEHVSTKNKIAKAQLSRRPIFLSKPTKPKIAKRRKRRRVDDFSESEVDELEEEEQVTPNKVNEFFSEERAPILLKKRRTHKSTTYTKNVSFSEIRFEIPFHHEVQTAHEAPRTQMTDTQQPSRMRAKTPEALLIIPSSSIATSPPSSTVFLEETKLPPPPPPTKHPSIATVSFNFVSESYPSQQLALPPVLQYEKESASPMEHQPVITQKVDLIGRSVSNKKLQALRHHPYNRASTSQASVGWDSHYTDESDADGERSDNVQSQQALDELGMAVNSSKTDDEIFLENEEAPYPIPKVRDTEGKWPCGIDECKKNFLRRADLIRHWKSARPHCPEKKGRTDDTGNSGNYMCQRCNTVFLRNDAYNRHMKRTRPCKPKAGVNLSGGGGKSVMVLGPRK